MRKLTRSMHEQTTCFDVYDIVPVMVVEGGYRRAGASRCGRVLTIGVGQALAVGGKRLNSGQMPRRQVTRRGKRARSKAKLA